MRVDRYCNVDLTITPILLSVNSRIIVKSSLYAINKAASSILIFMASPFRTDVTKHIFWTELPLNSVCHVANYGKSLSPICFKFQIHLRWRRRIFARDICSIFAFQKSKKKSLYFQQENDYRVQDQCNDIMRCVNTLRMFLIFLSI